MMNRWCIPIPSERALQAMWIIVSLAVVIAVGWLVFTVMSQAERLDQSPTVVDIDCTSSTLTRVTLTFSNSARITARCD